MRKWKNIETGAGVYLIRHATTGETYVGSTRNFRNRWRGHIALFKTRHWLCSRLVAAFSPHDSDKAVFEIIERCDPAEICTKEAEWIIRLRPSLNSSSYCGYGNTPKASRPGPYVVVRLK
jgi:excinuclease UvrABC nuclease subunit